MELDLRFVGSDYVSAYVSSDLEYPEQWFWPEIAGQTLWTVDGGRWTVDRGTLWTMERFGQ